MYVLFVPDVVVGCCDPLLAPSFAFTPLNVNTVLLVRVISFFKVFINDLFDFLHKINTSKNRFFLKVTNRHFRGVNHPFSDANMKNALFERWKFSQVIAYIFPFFLLIGFELLGTIFNLNRADISIYVIYYVFDILYFCLITFGYMPMIISWFKNKKLLLQQLIAALAIPVYGISLILYQAFVTWFREDHLILVFDFKTIHRSSLRGIMISGLAYTIAYARSAIKAEKKANEQRIHSLRLENNMLMLQTNPHLLNNVLNHLFERVQQYSIEDAKSIAILAQITSDSLSGTDEKGYITIEQEIRYLKAYLKLDALYKEKEPFDNLFIDITGFEHTMVPPKILLDPIVNMTKYGDLNNEQTPSFITLEVDKHQLRFSTYNRKRTNMSVSSRKIGLSNLRQRLELNYPGQYTLEINDVNNEFELQLKINLC